MRVLCILAQSTRARQPAARRRSCRLRAASAAADAAGADWRQKDPKDVRVLVVGATGYIGKFVTKELLKRGYNTVALARERSGIKGKSSPEDVRRVRRRSTAASLDWSIRVPCCKRGSHSACMWQVEPSAGCGRTATLCRCIHRSHGFTTTGTIRSLLCRRNLRARKCALATCRTRRT